MLSTKTVPATNHSLHAMLPYDNQQPVNRTDTTLRSTPLPPGKTDVRASNTTLFATLPSEEQLADSEAHNHTTGRRSSIKQKIKQTYTLGALLSMSIFVISLMPKQLPGELPVQQSMHISTIPTAAKDVYKAKLPLMRSINARKYEYAPVI